MHLFLPATFWHMRTHIPPAVASYTQGSTFFCYCFVFVFVFLFNGHNAEIQSLHKIPGCENKRKGPMGLFPKQPLGCLLESDADFRQIILRASLSSPLFPREVDPDDFSPCIKQETIITVEFIFF